MIALVSGYQNIDYKEKIVFTKYYPDDDYTISITRHANYDNDDRYSTYDYRHGYSYRSTKDFWDRHRSGSKTSRKLVKFNEGGRGYLSLSASMKYDNEKIVRGWGSMYWMNRDRIRESYYKYIDHLRIYEKRDCYRSAPRGKLFYIKCR